MTESKGTDWMYNPNADMNKEEYLLGKAIGKNFEGEGTMGQINAVEYDCAPPSIFASQAAHQVDLQRKLIEDPLVAIKKRELDDRRRILDNPVKMKALQEHIEELKRQKKDKKKKKKKRKKTKGSDSDDSDADLDLKLLKRIQKMEQGGGGDSDDDFEDLNAMKPKGSESPDEGNKQTKRYDDQRQRPGESPPRRKRSPDKPPQRRKSPSPYRRNRSPESSVRRRRSPDTPPRRKRSPDSPPRRNRAFDSQPRRKRSPDSPPRRGRKYPDSPPRRQRSPLRRKPRSPSNSPPRIKERSPYKRKSSSPSTSPPRRKPSSPPSGSPPRRPTSPSNSPPRKKAGLDLGRNYRKKSPVNNRGKSTKKVSKAGPEKKAALTDAEKQAKLAEMMTNATWRDEQRTSRVYKYREGQKKEDLEASKPHDKNFINRELKKAQESLTVEGRITANKYKIQRGHGDMDKNFAKR